MTKPNPLPAIMMTLALVAGSGNANAAEERWECCIGVTCDPNKDDIAVRVTADRTNRIGMITFADITHHTTFSIIGFDRLWFWNRFPLKQITARDIEATTDLRGAEAKRVAAEADATLNKMKILNMPSTPGLSHKQLAIISSLSKPGMVKRIDQFRRESGIYVSNELILQQLEAYTELTSKDHGLDQVFMIDPQRRGHHIFDPYPKAGEKPRLRNQFACRKR